MVLLCVVLLVVLLVVPGAAGAVRVLVTVVVCAGVVVVVVSVLVDSVLVESVLVVSAQAVPPAMAPTATPAIRTLTIRSADLRTAALAARRRTACTPITRRASHRSMRRTTRRTCVGHAGVHPSGGRTCIPHTSPRHCLREERCQSRTHISDTELGTGVAVRTAQATIDITSDETGWAALFWEAFRRSKNAMILLDAERRYVDVNRAYLALLGYPKERLIGRPVYELVADGPLMSAEEWRALLRRGEFTGAAELVSAGGGRVPVEFAGHPEIVTGRQLVLFVAMATTRPARSKSGEITFPGERPALSRREVDVIRLLADGLTGPEVAEELQLAHNTVRTHVRNAMGKSGARSRAQLVALALAEGLYLN